MGLMIDLPAPLELRLRQVATKQNLSVDKYLATLIEQAISVRSSRRVSKPLTEKALLKKINLPITETEWTTYRSLIALRRAEQLTETQLAQLVALGDKIEIANAKRLQYLWALAQLRKISLRQIMQDLGIQPVEVF
ncbi:MAG: hypothetical protein RLZZ628_354 [Bacteroidota bacterium]